MLIKDAANQFNPPPYHEIKLPRIKVCRSIFNTEFDVNVYVYMNLFFPLHLTQ